MSLFKALLLVVGEPGIGKSTAVRAMTSHFHPEPVLVPIAHINYRDEHGTLVLQQLGREREGFSGTDALAMDVIEKAERWLTMTGADKIVAEGTRLANVRFLTSAVEAGWTPRVVLLENPGLAAARRVQRGSAQDATWVRGRQTAARNLLKALPEGVSGRRIKLTGNETPEQVGDILAMELETVF